MTIRSFTQALEIDPACARAHCGLAFAYGPVGDMARAQEHYAELQQLDPGLAGRFAETPAGVLVVRGGKVVFVD